MDVTVRIMNSHNYGHFEVTLTEKDVEELEVVDSLRQQAQKLVRDAIADYKAVLAAEHKAEQEEWKRQSDAAIERGEIPF